MWTSFNPVSVALRDLKCRPIHVLLFQRRSQPVRGLSDSATSSIITTTTTTTTTIWPIIKAGN